MPLPKLFRTSSFRLTLMYAVLTGVIFLLLFSMIFWSTTRYMQQQLDARVASEIAELLAYPQATQPAGLLLGSRDRAGRGHGPVAAKALLARALGPGE